MKRHDIILICIIVAIAIFFLRRNKEKLDNTSVALSNEAIQNIASVYSNTGGTATFNNMRITGVAEIGNFKGIIVMWSGTKESIPNGWNLCDGTNNTPDLRGRFILGSGKGNELTERKTGDTGGEENVVLNIDNIPQHDHDTKIWKHTRSFKGDNDYMHALIHVDDKGGDVTFKSNKTGGGKSHNNMPPYYALAFIMKQ